MKVLLINGSPRCESSHSYLVAKHFLQGMADAGDVQIKELTLARLDIGHCKGCFACWKITPGKCAIRDDMDKVISEILDADTIILSFPLYCFGVSSLVSAMIDRLLPMKLPYNGRPATDENINILDFRYDLTGKKLVLVSSCAHATTDYVFESVNRQFDLFVGEGAYTTVYCPQGEIMLLDQMKPILNNHLGKIRKAGSEFMTQGFLSEETHRIVNSPMIPPRAMEKMMTGYWEGFTQQ